MSSSGFELGRGTLDQAISAIMKASGRSQDDNRPVERVGSPGSQEVFDILSHSQSQAEPAAELEEGELLDDDNADDEDDDDDGDACDDVSYCAYEHRDDSATPDAKRDASRQSQRSGERRVRRRPPLDRPETPVAHTLATVPTESSIVGMSASVCAPIDVDATAPQWRGADHRAAADLAAAAIADSNFRDLRDTLSKMSMELERLVCHMQRHEDELAGLKQSLVPEEHHVHKELKALGDAVHDNNSSIKHVHSMLLAQRDQLTSQLDKVVCSQQQLGQEQSRPPQVDLEPLKKEAKAAIGEMHKEVAGSINTVIQRTTSRMEQEYKTRVANTDVALREAVVRAATSKPTLETLSSSVVHGIKDNVSTSYKEAFRHVIVPAFEEHTKRMFNEVNKSFHAGTTEYLDQVKSAWDRERAESAERRAAAEEQLRTEADKARAQLQTVGDKLAMDIQTHMEQHAAALEKKLVETTVSSIKSAMRDELSRGLADQKSMLADSIRQMNQAASVSASRGATPAPVKPESDRQAILRDVMHALQTNNYELAFSKALSACDMGILMQLCQKVDAKDVFEPCPLPQPVLMSLLQQLSHEIATNTDTKLDYIEAAIMALEPAAADNASHMPRIINRIVSTMNGYIVSQAPSSPHARKAKLIKMAAQSLCAGTPTNSPAGGTHKAPAAAKKEP